MLLSVSVVLNAAWRLCIGERLFAGVFLLRALLVPRCGMCGGVTYGGCFVSDFGLKVPGNL